VLMKMPKYLLAVVRSTSNPNNSAVYKSIMVLAPAVSKSALQIPLPIPHRAM
jgi:hypothetical protein